MNKQQVLDLLSPVDMPAVEKPAYAVAMILDFAASTPSILFVERAKARGDHWSGDIAFPGGKKEKQDTSLVETAIRETEEEIGLSLEQDMCLGLYKTIPVRRKGQVEEGSISAFVFAASHDFEVSLSHEISELIVLPISDVLRRNRRSFKILQRQNMTVKIPGIQINENNILWGMTYSLFANLVYDLSLQDDIPLY